MIACRENQGFQLLLPGAFFDVMQSKKIQKGDKKAYLKMKNEFRNGNPHDFVSENYSNILLCDYPLLRDKEFEFLVNVYMKKIRLKKPPPD